MDIRCPYTSDSNEVLEFKLVRHVDEIESSEIAFKPVMSHQVFGQSEQIVGYKQLKVKLYYSAGLLKPYFGIEYADKKEVDGVPPEDIESRIKDFLQPGYFTSVDLFCQALEKDESFRPSGILLNSFESEDGKCYEIYHNDTSDKSFIDFHERLQTFLLWYIDAASFLAIEDDRWKFFVLYEKYKNANNHTAFAIAGYITAYEYYAYPEHIRPRISQVLILPPFQKKGLCAKLLKSVYNHYTGRSQIKDITVEDPSEEFQRVRDFVDCSVFLNLPEFSANSIKNGYSKQDINIITEKTKLNKRQLRRVLEILLLKQLNMHNQREMLNYENSIKKRLLIRIKRNNLLRQPVEVPIGEEPGRGPIPDSSTAICNGALKYVLLNPNPNSQEEADAQFADKIDELYKDIFEQYKMVIDRLNKVEC